HYDIFQSIEHSTRRTHDAIDQTHNDLLADPKHLAVQADDEVHASHECRFDIGPSLSEPSNRKEKRGFDGVPGGVNQIGRNGDSGDEKTDGVHHYGSAQEQHGATGNQCTAFQEGQDASEAGNPCYVGGAEKREYGSSRAKQCAKSKLQSAKPD